MLFTLAVMSLALAAVHQVYLRSGMFGHVERLEIKTGEFLLETVGSLAKSNLMRWFQRGSSGYYISR